MDKAIIDHKRHDHEEESGSNDNGHAQRKTGLMLEVHSLVVGEGNVDPRVIKTSVVQVTFSSIESLDGKSMRKSLVNSTQWYNLAISAIVPLTYRFTIKVVCKGCFAGALENASYSSCAFGVEGLQSSDPK